jgi:hypothetical protein
MVAGTAKTPHNSIVGEFLSELISYTRTYHEATLKITKNMYSHMTQEMKKEASQKFVQLMRSFFMLEIC